MTKILLYLLRFCMLGLLPKKRSQNLASPYLQLSSSQHHNCKWRFDLPWFVIVGLHSFLQNNLERALAQTASSIVTLNRKGDSVPSARNSGLVGEPRQVWPGHLSSFLMFAGHSTLCVWFIFHVEVMDFQAMRTSAMKIGTPVLKIRNQ